MVEKEESSFDVENIEIVPRKTLQYVAPISDIKKKAASFHTDHMLDIKWGSQGGWSTPKIMSYCQIKFDPKSTCLHYGLSCIEGMKAYLGEDMKIRSIRPLDIVTRLKGTCEQLGLPSFSPTQLLKCIEKLVELDCKRWLVELSPKLTGNDKIGLYIRPVVFSTDTNLFAGVPEQARLIVMMFTFIISTPDPVNLWLTAQFPRPSNKGKISGNYCLNGVSVQIGNSHPVMKDKKPCAQCLFYSRESFISECSTMNIFFVFRQGGEKTLVTPELTDWIFPGLIRDCILNSTFNSISNIEERKISIEELEHLNINGDVHTHTHIYIYIYNIYIYI